MNRIKPWLKEYFRRADMLLLALCCICTLYGIVVISSATQSYNTPKYVVVQGMAMCIGIGLYVVMTVLDIDVLADKWMLLCAFNVLFLGILIPFGVDGDTGNSGWLRFFGVGIQPSEVVKVTYIIIMSKHISHVKEHGDINSIVSVGQLAIHFVLIFGLLLVTSKDLGSALVYFFIFALLLFIAGVKVYWFLIGLAALAAVTPFIWTEVLKPYQRNRILAPYVPSIDPDNTGVNWQPNQAKIALASGRLTGTGLGEGAQTQSPTAVFGKHTDFVFASIGEELGMIGCCIVLLLLGLIVVRCIMIGLRSHNTLSMLVCFGVAGTVIFQTFENVGMCIGVAPVVGITLPFFSYGGSSIISMFAAMGLVSGVRYRPKPQRFRMYS